MTSSKDIKLSGILKLVKPVVIPFLDTFLRNRVLHDPETELARLAEEAGVTPAQYRAVEAVKLARIEEKLQAL